MSGNETAFSVILIALAAFLLPLVADRLKVPAVVLEILFGIIVGPSVLNLIHESEVIGYLAELGFFLLMFLSGFEIDLRQLERGGARQIAVGLAVFVLTILLAYRASVWLDLGPFVTLVLATTSVGLVVPTLRAGGRIGTRLGQAILIAALLADFLTLIAATVYAMVVEYGVGVHLMNFPLLFLIIALTLTAMKRLAWWYPDWFQRLFDADDPEEMGIRTSLALMFVFVGVSYLLKVEAILGAFLAGTVFALVFRHRGALEQKLTGFSYGFLVPIFFIHVGLNFDLQVLMRPGVFYGALTLIAAGVAIKIFASAPLFLLRLSPREVLSAGVLLTTRLSLVIAVAEIGTRLGILDHIVESEVVLLAVVTSTLSPIVFRLIAPPPRARAG